MHVFNRGTYIVSGGVMVDTGKRGGGPEIYCIYFVYFMNSCVPLVHIYIV